MATETQSPIPATSQSVPQLTVLTRVASIPLISDSLAAVHSTLINNAYTKTPYNTAQALTNYAYNVTSPIQVRLAPVIQRADGIANKAVDVVESRYPYPFHAPTEEIYGTLKAHSEHAYDVANKTIDDKVRTPAYGIVHGIDQRFTPVVDKFASVVNSIHAKQCSPSDAGAPGPDTTAQAQDEFQYKRAYRLSMDLKDTLYVLTNEQIKQIQEHNSLVQRATATAHTISSTISSSVEIASQRIHTLSDTMVAELHSLQSSAAALPSAIQSSLGLPSLSEKLGPVIGEVKEALGGEGPVKEKLVRLGKVVEERVKPVLEGASAKVQALAVRARTLSEGSKPVTINGVDGAVVESPTENGNSH